MSDVPGTNDVDIGVPIAEIALSFVGTLTGISVLRIERIVLILLLLGGLTLSSIWLTGRSFARATALEAMNGRLIFTSARYVAPDGPPDSRLIDGDPATALPDLNAPARRTVNTPRPGSDSPAWPWSVAVPFVQLQVGLTHAPGRPPIPNALRAMRLWTGNQSSPEAYRQSARPRTVRLIFFRQQVVDLDREYRLPETPVFWRETTVRLVDRPGMQRVFLDFLDEPPESPGFPREVQQIWLRMEILDSYPGSVAATRDHIAFSEIRFEFQRPLATRTSDQTNRP